VKSIFDDPRWAWVAFGAGAAATIVAAALFAAIVFLVIRSSNRQVVAAINRALEEAKRMPIQLAQQYLRIEKTQGGILKELRVVQDRVARLEDEAKARGAELPPLPDRTPEVAV